MDNLKIQRRSILTYMELINGLSKIAIITFVLTVVASMVRPRLQKFFIVITVLCIVGMLTACCTITFNFADRVDQIEKKINNPMVTRGIKCSGGLKEGKPVWNFGYYKKPLIGEDAVELSVFKPKIVSQEEAGKVIYRHYYILPSCKLFFLFPIYFKVETNVNTYITEDIWVLVDKSWAKEMKNKWQISFSWY